MEKAKALCSGQRQLLSSGELGPAMSQKEISHLGPRRERSGEVCEAAGDRLVETEEDGRFPTWERGTESSWISGGCLQLGPKAINVSHLAQQMSLSDAKGKQFSWR